MSSDALFVTMRGSPDIEYIKERMLATAQKQIFWTPCTPTTSDTTTWLYPEIQTHQTWNININLEYEDSDNYGNCGGYIP